MTVQAGAETGSTVPVFFDKLNKRWRRVLVSITVLLLAFAGVGIWLAPEAPAPLWHAQTNQASGYPQQLLTGSGLHTMPVIGDEWRNVLARVDLVRHRAGRTYLIDPFTGRTIRRASRAEARQIGAHSYALEWFSHPADHQLMLTFDDGPDPQNTPKILDILSREHVPATFFVVGQNGLRYPSLLRREIREGHTVGSHTVTHTGSGHGNAMDREELVGDDRIVRAAAGYGTRLFRMPYGDPDSNPLTVLEAQQLGYLNVNFDLDTNDWAYQPGQTVPLPKLDGRGHVVLMHDGGGHDRSRTIRLLERLIAEAKSRGYSFVTVASLVPRDYLPTHARPSLADRVTWIVLWTVLVLPGKLVGWLFWFGAGSLAFMSLLYVALALIDRHRQNTRKWRKPAGAGPLVSVILPAYNEEKVVAKTLASLLKVITRALKSWRWTTVQATTPGASSLISPAYGLSYLCSGTR